MNTHNLSDAVDYQPGSIVSKEILKKQAGSMTLFAFDQGQGLSEHTAPFDAMVHLLDGQAEITIEGKPFQISAGQVLVMPADKPHALAATERFKMLLTMIRS